MPTRIKNGEEFATSQNMKMPFGMYQGELVANLPDGYLAWLMEEVSFDRPLLREIVKAEWKERGCPQKERLYD